MAGDATQRIEAVCRRFEQVHGEPGAFAHGALFSLRRLAQIAPASGDAAASFAENLVDILCAPPKPTPPKEPSACWPWDEVPATCLVTTTRRKP